jgi:hypothetical protein
MACRACHHAPMARLLPSLRRALSQRSLCLEDSSADLVVGRSVPVVVVPGHPESAQLGEVPTANGVAAVAGVVAVTIFMFFFQRSQARSRPWYGPAPVIDHGFGVLGDA